MGYLILQKSALAARGRAMGQMDAEAGWPSAVAGFALASRRSEQSCS
jgi:hypothetical protein